ncbi:hypothetical protein [Spiroplasma diminutum]|uniref:Ribosome maturation factor RimP n=1 Tax=Spiroplasma diminutum CUAS-1 TaxID=1276221 RepID=S5MK10_9MOLU|nr:hypothetical protein [Spiroplasma diminutum]AGR42300.1 ribosome maturation factor RimP [Spiroplasma diminutum CUAS-1]
MSLEIVKNNYLDKVKEIVNECEFSLYEINIVNDFESTVLQVLVENKDFSKKNIDFDSLIKANEKLSVLLDNINELKDPYILEVGSAGAERVVKSKDLLINSIGSFFYLKVIEPIESFNEFSATLNDYKNDEFSFNFFIKGRPKKVNLKWEAIEFIRFAVKF